MANENKPILIAGAGIASLLLAQSLRVAGVAFRIFERDESFVFRAQGYRLRLSKEGLDAIESVLDKETWEIFWESCGKTAGAGVVMIDAVTGETQQPPGPPENLTSRGGQTIGIARGDMRRIFSRGCEEHIYWSKNVTGYRLTETGVVAHFSDGTSSEEGSMLVGGEGIYSKVAKQLSGGRIKVYDTGARGVHGQAPSTAFKGLGEGVFLMRDTTGPVGPTFAITNVRPGELDDPNVNFGWTMGGHPGVIQVPNDDYTIIGQQAADIAQAVSKNWHPRIKPLFDNMVASEAAFWKITCSSPSGVPQWPNEPRVTVIGDAVHSMTPAGGNGANTAVRDSALLGKLLAEAKGYGPYVTRVYEDEMRVYASEAVRLSYEQASTQGGISIDEETTPTV